MLTAVVLGAVAPRPTIVSVSRVLGEVQVELGLPASSAGAITTASVLCMAVFAPVSTRAAARWGSEATVAGGLALVAVATTVRM